MSIIVSNCQHCDKQQFQTLPCVHYTIFSIIKLNLFIRADLLLDQILFLEDTTRTLRVHLVIACMCVHVYKYVYVYIIICMYIMHMWVNMVVCIFIYDQNFFIPVFVIYIFFSSFKLDLPFRL